MGGFFKALSGLAETAGFGKVSAAFAEEAMSSAAISKNVCNNIMAENGADLLRMAAKNADLGDDFAKAASEALKKGAPENAIADTISTYRKAIEGAAGKNEAFKIALDTYDKSAQILKSGTGMAQAEQLLGREAGSGLGIIGTAKGFYGNPEHGATRIKATAAAYAGVAVGERLLSGGSLTTNARGEHDIAGIPFI